MKRSSFIVLMCAFATVAFAADAPPAPASATTVAAAKGQMLISAPGARLGAVYRLSTDGSPQIIIDGKMVTIPASTLSTVDGKLTTTLTKSQVLALQ